MDEGLRAEETPSPRSHLRDCRGAAEYGYLVDVWRSAVMATHHFLAEADRVAIESRLIEVYFPQVRLTVMDVDGRVIAFSGTAGDSLDMLFVAADARGRGAGSELLAHAVRAQGVRRVDVNEQNEQAVRFYMRRGFVVVGRSDHDEAGRPYPLLHMTLEA
ncbi:GNAT family N-acetyltransferase [Nocardia fusca]|uniref:GNAT family N-acetyltransferase n=1 Tax=Nocardia fusca TaxID=941183 RepID=UPI0007A7310D|nr:GNAT family N-acetyltransferase [Nocardia fusca]